MPSLSIFPLWELVGISKNRQKANRYAIVDCVTVRPYLMKSLKNSKLKKTKPNFLTDPMWHLYLQDYIIDDFIANCCHMINWLTSGNKWGLRNERNRIRISLLALKYFVWIMLGVRLTETLSVFIEQADLKYYMLQNTLDATTVCNEVNYYVILQV